MIPKTKRGETQRWIEVHVDLAGDGCLIWPFHRNWRGYAVINRGNRPIPACREMCRLKHGEPPTERHEAAHRCGNGHHGCINPNHLSWKTHAENCADTITHGTSTRGHRNGQCKLSVRAVRSIRKSKKTQRQLAIQHGVDQSTISNIKSRKLWGWLQ